MNLQHLVFAIFFFATQQIFAQTPQMFQRLDYPVTVNGKQLSYPFTGGMNVPQVSEADLNQDGIKDLCVFDRVGNVLSTFLNGGKAGVSDYRYAPEYACYFPPLEHYVLLRDFDSDGAADLFAASTIPGSQEIMVWKGYFENKILKFKQMFFKYAGCPSCIKSEIYYFSTTGKWVNLAVARDDYPAVDDIDGDGDLDIVTFTTSQPGFPGYFLNESVEKGFGLDSLIFRLEDNCWGKFYESGMLSCRCDLSSTPDSCKKFFTDQTVVDRDGLHAGSTVLTYDHDGDGDKDLILGDLSYSCLNQLTNTGTKTRAWMTAQDTIFPSNSEVPVNIDIFPAAFYVDVNNDGRKDLLAAPNNVNRGEDQTSLWLYLNTGMGKAANFEYESKRFLIGEMLDVGTASHPAIADVNGDDLLDLVVGNYGFYDPVKRNYENGRLTLFLNVGTFDKPAFELADRDWLLFSEFSPDEYDFSPTFGDLDGDLDLDLVVGSSKGALFFYRNTAGVGQAMKMERDPNVQWELIDVGSSSTAPTIYDLDKDGKNDIISGTRNGFVAYFKNNGPSVTEPRFGPNPTLKFLGNITSLQTCNTYGYSAPTIINTPTGNMMFNASNCGNIVAYKDVNPSTQAFTVQEKNFGNVDEGYRTHSVFADIDNDGKLEMVVGNGRGGLSIFKTELADCKPLNTNAISNKAKALNISPNPARHFVRATWQEAGDLRWRVLDVQGRLISSGISSTPGVVEVNVQHCSPGLYTLEAFSADKRAVGRFVVSGY